MADTQVFDTTGNEMPPEVFLPDSVRRQINRANELIAEQKKASSGETPLEQGPAEQAPEPQPQPRPVPEPQPEQPAWEQRYRTLQGKYDSEISGLRSQVAGLENLLATLQHQPPAQPAPLPSQPGPVHYRDEDVQLFGEDLLAAATRAAEARYDPIITRLEGELQQIRGSAGQLSEEQLQNRMFTALDRDPELAGRWSQLNTDQGFLLWLQQIDEYSGVSRKDMLQHAYRNGDAVRTGRFFKKYMAEHTVPSTLTAPAQTYAAPVQGNGYAAPASTMRLEDFAAPGRASGSGESNGAPSTRIWLPREISAFYRDRTSGKFRGRDDESARIEADIIAAAREGRVQR